MFLEFECLESLQCLFKFIFTKQYLISCAVSTFESTLGETLRKFFTAAPFKTRILLQMCKWFIVKEAEMLFVLVYVNIHNNEPL